MSSNQNQAEERPVVLTANARSERLQKQRERATQTIEELIDQVDALGDRIRKGEVVKKAEATSALGELKYWLRAARETELELEAIKRKEEGIHDAYGLDLDQAYTQIGCRLARLRSCCGAQEVSE